MKTTLSIQKMTTAALLIAIGIVIPMFSPLKIVLEPASFTLASHVPIFIAMFISPIVAVAVSVGTTIGFFLGGFPIVIVLRAAVHLVFALGGAFYLKYRPAILNSIVKTQIFSLVVGIVHALAELIVVSIFYFAGSMGQAFYAQGFLTSVLLLVGVGSVVHSMVDFIIALAITKILVKQPSLRKLFSTMHMAKAATEEKAA